MKTDLKYRSQQSITFADYDANMRRQMYWSGQWTAKQYEPNEVVENVGLIWICVNTTTTQPGTAAGLTDWDSLGNLAVEFWQATPITGMNAETIQWTFLPIFTGQTPQILTEASGVFTFQTVGAVVDFQYSTHISFEYAANNSEANYLITPTYSGSGLSTLLPILDSDSSTRAGSFGRTAIGIGTVIAAVADTVTFIANSAGTNGSDVDLLNMFLQVTGPTP